MALLTLPFLYINLGGEMLYILNQRLTTQKSHVTEEKRCKVMRDIVDHMLRLSTVDRLFIPKPLATSQQLKADFTKLAHASIMKLNNDAMDKLFDLMQMAVKYQVMMCKSGDELLLITLNHLDGIRKLIGASDKHISLVDQTCIKLAEATSSLNTSQFMMVRHVLLGYFQGCHKKVSIFLSTGIQRPDGRFILPTDGPVPQYSEQPGTIRYSNGKVDHFSHPHQFTAAQRPPSTKVIGDRVITLGNDIYSAPVVMTPPTKTKKSSPVSVDKQQETEPVTAKDQTELRAKAELDFLQHLLIGFQSQPSNSTFKLSMFDDEDSSSDTAHRGVLDSINTIRIDGSKSSSSTGELGKILSDFETSKSATPTTSSGDDLLNLMDTL